eukprot:CAMPEP_0172811616 /NCGR_PEP_ID=MMETSP1075-20121228/9531_1 /TAXON_ID=2916 /ORGANISM="Ceratium fusus, Strain PA161109" /LENGTH=83 /DNA_ID=CAMNT_0013651065 /DNA_START=13 /DNA_END=264 /DNA_ORIENTATION=-
MTANLEKLTGNQSTGHVVEGDNPCTQTGLMKDCQHGTQTYDKSDWCSECRDAWKRNILDPRRPVETTLYKSGVFRQNFIYGTS